MQNSSKKRQLKRLSKHEELEVLNLIDKCSQIVNNDRNLLRKLVKESEEELINFLIKHRKKPDLSLIQQELRRFINKLKGKQPYIANPMYQVFKENLKSSPSVESLRKQENYSPARTKGNSKHSTEEESSKCKGNNKYYIGLSPQLTEKNNVSPSADNIDVLECGSNGFISPDNKRGRHVNGGVGFVLENNSNLLAERVGNVQQPFFKSVFEKQTIPNQGSTKTSSTTGNFPRRMTETPKLVDSKKFSKEKDPKLDEEAAFFSSLDDENQNFYYGKQSCSEYDSNDVLSMNSRLHSSSKKNFEQVNLSENQNIVNSPENFSYDYGIRNQERDDSIHSDKNSSFKDLAADDFNSHFKIRTNGNNNEILLSPQFETRGKGFKSQDEQTDNIDEMLEIDGADTFMNDFHFESKKLKENTVTFANFVSIPKQSEIFKKQNDEDTIEATRNVCTIDLFSQSLSKSRSEELEKQDGFEVLNGSSNEREIIEAHSNVTQGDQSSLSHSIMTSTTNMSSQNYKEIKLSNEKIYATPIDLPKLDSRFEFSLPDNLTKGLHFTFSKNIPTMNSAERSADFEKNKYLNFTLNDISSQINISPLGRPNFSASFRKYVHQYLDLEDKSAEEIFDNIICDSGLTRISKAFFNLRMESFLKAENGEKEYGVLNEVYSAFDLKKDGFLDSNELGYSLEVFCKKQPAKISDILRKFFIELCETSKYDYLTPITFYHSIENTGLLEGDRIKILTQEFFLEVDRDGKGYATYWDVHLSKHSDVTRKALELLKEKILN